MNHGMSKTAVYCVWADMKGRCANPTHQAFKNYGARGITVCDRWLSFENFYADMGEPNGLTLERKKNHLGYSKENCLWATEKVQANNQRNCLNLTYAGRTMTLTQWAEGLGVDRRRLYKRVQAKWPIYDVLFKSARAWSRA